MIPQGTAAAVAPSVTQTKGTPEHLRSKNNQYSCAHWVRGTLRQFRSGGFARPPDLIDLL